VIEYIVTNRHSHFAATGKVAKKREKRRTRRNKKEETNNKVTGRGEKEAKHALPLLLLGYHPILIVACLLSFFFSACVVKV